MQLPSVKMLLEEFDDDVDVFEIDVAEGVQQLSWEMKKILVRLKGNVVEIGMDATCKAITL